MCPTSSVRVGVYIALHPKVLVVGVYKLVVRGLSPKYRLCMVDRALLATLVCVCGLALSCNVVSVSWMCALCNTPGVCH